VVDLAVYGRVYAAIAAAALALAMLWYLLLPPQSGVTAMPMHVYRNLVGELDGRACPSWPVCSLYTTQALARYGALIGSWLALDRIIHEHDDLRRGPWVIVAGRERLYDPLARNDFWLRGARADAVAQQ